MRRVALALTTVLLLAIAAEPAAADDGIPVRGPANGATFPTSSTIVLEIDEPWFDAQAAGTFRLRVATDPALAQAVYTHTGPCPAGTQPTCQPLDAIGPLPAGMYFWRLEVDFPDQPPHVSEVWTFAVTAPKPSTAPLDVSDAPGDGDGAPGITQVEVTTDGADQLQVQVTIPGLTSLGPDETVHLLIDADQRAATGNTGDLGAEYWFSLTGNSNAPSTYRFRRWDVPSSSWVYAGSKTTRARYRNGVLFVLRLSDIGGPTPGINFWAESDKGSGEANVFDRAPDASMANYQLPAGAATANNAQAIVAFPIVTSPVAPRSGKPLRVSVPVLVLGSGTQAHPELVQCVGAVAGHRVRGSGPGGCRLAVPIRTAGKVLRLTVTVYFGPATARRTVALRIRR